MSSDLNDKVAIVTGAGSGIGEAIALAIAAHGASVVATDISSERANATAQRIVSEGGKAAALASDAVVPSDAEKAVEFARSTFGNLHLAVNNAGIADVLTPVGEYDIDEWRRQIDVNLNGVFYGLRFQIPAILQAGGGSIVNISSVLGLSGGAEAPGYTAAKHGVAGLTKSAALAYANQGLRVNSVHPGYIQTPLLDFLPRERYSGVVAMHPMGRLGTAKEVAELVVFLLSDRASFTTGAQYTVDGGYSAV